MKNREKEAFVGTKQRVLSWTLPGLALLAVQAGFGAAVLADDCLGLARETAAAGEPLRLCRQDVNGRSETFACQEFSDAGNRYLLLFKDSPFPRVMVLHRGNPGIARVRSIDSAATGSQVHPASVFLDADRAGYH
jgi:hypothetical protein